MAEKTDFEFKYEVEEASDWTHLFYRKSGWFGADGIFSIPLDGNDINAGDEMTMLIFSDTYIGEVKDNAPLPGNEMVNNTIAYMKDREPEQQHITFHYKKGKDQRPEAFFVPNNENAKEGQYFWLGDGFVNQSLNNQMYIFAYHVEMTGPGVFDFIEPNVSLIAVPERSTIPFQDHRQITTPLHITHPDFGEGNFGCGILVNTMWAGSPNPDGYVYVYACIGNDKNLLVGRVKPKHFEQFGKWRYWDGATWQKEVLKSKSITNAVSNELSVTPLPDGRFLMVFQVLGISDKVGMRVGTSPVGPWSDIIEIYRTPEIDDGLLPYNAKAHPALSKPGELLISYNTITADFWNDIQKDAHIYRPRFIKLLYK
ncbi:MAG: DUF4185 domain-containing protein [Saprospiraceae bacterium]|nr:DUF4185 domain-containing protein [Saprospiraceae bacterium]